MRVRLRTKTPIEKPARVDRSGNGAILGASIIRKGEALGHGFWIDDTTLDQVAKLTENAAGRWTHGDACSDGLGTHLGRWKNVHREGDAVLGDFHFSALAKNVKPEGLAVDAPTYLMDAAEKEPEVVGVSAVLDIERFDDEEEPEEGKEPKKLARLGKVPRADYVADPAANPEGLFAGTPSELAERYAVALSAATETHGRERVESFLRAYLGQRTQEVQTVDIEALKKKHAEELAAKDTALTLLESTIKEREKELSEFRAERLERQKKDLDGVIEKLVADCQAAGATPPEKAERDELRAALDANEALGRRLVAAVKDRCLAVVGRSTTKTTTLDPAKTQAEEKRKKFLAGVNAPAGASKAKED